MIGFDPDADSVGSDPPFRQTGQQPGISSDEWMRIRGVSAATGSREMSSRSHRTDGAKAALAKWVCQGIRYQLTLCQECAYLDFGAEEGTRTPTPLRVHGPEPCASANSATSARRDSARLLASENELRSDAGAPNGQWIDSIAFPAVGREAHGRLDSLQLQMVQRHPLVQNTPGAGAPREFERGRVH